MSLLSARIPVTWGQYQLCDEGTDSHWPEWLEEGSQQWELEPGSDGYYARCRVTRDALDLPMVGVFETMGSVSAFCSPSALARLLCAS